MRITRKIQVGTLAIGGGERIAIQSMTNTSTKDADATGEQLRRLELCGCDIARIAFCDRDECGLIPTFKTYTSMPLVADIQFDYRLAISAMENGIDKVRFNPGNIGDDGKVKRLLDCAKAHRTPIRIGVNSGSLPSDIAESDRTAEEKLVSAALRHVRLCEDNGFDQLVLSVKSSSAQTVVKAYRMLAERADYPLHIGVTEAGSFESALVKSSVALGSLLMDGIGDTIRVSVTGDIEEEVRAARLILQACGIEKDFCDIISCPTCARTHIDLLKLEEQVRIRYGAVRYPMKLAVMGCIVNGPGEARDADFGIAGGDGKGVIFQKGEIVRTVSEEELFSAFCSVVDEWLDRVL